jgi:putative transposase
MPVWLTKDKGYKVSKNLIERLYYQVMGLRANLPGRHTSRRCKEHKTYPYLLKNLTIERPNQVWATDITYIPLKKGYMYLVAIIDLHSRYVLNPSISNSMDAQWCKQALQEAIEVYGTPEILNTDQGSQLTAEEFANYVLGQGIRLSMDGKGRATDNAFIGRLWRNVKYEKIYLNPPTDGMDLYLLLAEYFHYYNHQRRHRSIDYKITAEIFKKAA